MTRPCQGITQCIVGGLPMHCIGDPESLGPRLPSGQRWDSNVQRCHSQRLVWHRRRRARESAHMTGATKGRSGGLPSPPDAHCTQRNTPSWHGSLLQSGCSFQHQTWNGASQIWVREAMRWAWGLWLMAIGHSGGGLRHPGQEKQSMGRTCPLVVDAIAPNGKHIPLIPTKSHFPLGATEMAHGQPKFATVNQYPPLPPSPTLDCHLRILLSSGVSHAPFPSIPAVSPGPPLFTASTNFASAGCRRRCPSAAAQPQTKKGTA